MTLNRVKSCLNEEQNLLEPCWIAGNAKPSSSTNQFVKLFASHEINAINVVATCEHIRKIQAKSISIDGENTGHRMVTFKDMARLTFGVSYIFNKQVSSLLDDTKHLLDQIMKKNFDLSYPNMRSNEKATLNYRKRKRIISKQTTTTLCVAKRQRVKEVKLLNEPNIEYYRHMLTESQQWSTDSSNLMIEQSATIEVGRNCLAEHLFSFSHELTLTEINENELWNDGFGESNQANITALEEFLPLRNCLKRQSTVPLPTGVLCYKMPRLGTHIAEENQNETLQSVESQVAIQGLELPQSRHKFNDPVPQYKSNRKVKLIRDKRIRYSRMELMRDRETYFKKLQRLKAKSSILHKHIINGKSLLNSFRQSHLFPDRLNKDLHLNVVQMELQCESTLRSILGSDYSDGLASEILSTRQIISPSGPSVLPALEPIDNPSPPTVENNNKSTTINKNPVDLNNIDSLSVMMELLNIWRSNPDQKSIDANQFVKSFPSRLKAALVFSHLLNLSKDGFIVLSTKAGSVEVATITLGTESYKIFENFMSSEQLN